jgi:hypothetical protein
MLGARSDSELFRATPRTCPAVGGRLSIRESLRPCRRDAPMNDRVEDGRSWASDIAWVAFYSILILLLMLLWVYVPA